MLDLSVKDLIITSAGGRRLLTVPQLTVPAGRTLAIRGPSGAGKSTLLFALAGLIPVDAGQVMWGRQDLAGASDHARTGFRGRNFGIIFQDHLLFEELSAAQNAGLAALYRPRRERAGIAKAAQATLSALKVPWQTRRGVTSFSGGERQRIAVARALAADPPVILADEPTASLDRETADSLIADLFGFARDKGRTLIVVSHDPAMLAEADQVLSLKDGQVLQDV